MIQSSIIKNTSALAIVFILSGCSYQLMVMPRDSGKMYHGEAVDNGGSGTVKLVIDNRTYNGRWVKTSSNDSFTILSTYGKNNRGGVSIGTGFAQNYSLGGTGKAMLSSPDGKGMRCEFIMSGHGAGGGICIDDEGRVFDVQYYY